MVEGDGFGPSKAEPADLQSAPFSHSGTPPKVWAHYKGGLIWLQVFFDIFSEFSYLFHNSLIYCNNSFIKNFRIAEEKHGCAENRTKSLVGTLISKLHCPPLHCGVMRPRVLLPLQRRFYEAGQISRNLIYNLPVRADRPRGLRFTQQHGSPGFFPGPENNVWRNLS